ncbi:DNA repair RAD52-like protein 1, mitochondrial [Argentina anserina]|uniref:DNA repair RAD52-like protein 1, mitochondrial n=1 Tax=Argentina anserina TaxID=57926 RepID=UPI00217651B9|nr:DNA repair RAD52-like protein 1, mitochondrial [Potentilla anserina]
MAHACRSCLLKLLRVAAVFQSTVSHRSYAKMASMPYGQGRREKPVEVEADEGEDLDDFAVSSGISRPLSEILKQINKKVPDALIKFRHENGFTSKYIPWHVVNRIMNLHAPEWSGEVRSITYSADAKTVSVVYRVTLYGTDAVIFRESVGTASVDDTSYGDPVQKAEAMAFRRACARFGLGLHLYHEDLS